jgi:branched-chain amino acid transport system permease protein
MPGIGARHVLLAGVGVLLAVVLVSGEYRPVFLSGAGVAQGALIAAIALGVVLTYRGSGVVNLANGSVAMYAAYVYAVLRGEGDLFLPPLPNPLSLVEGVVHWFQADDSLDLPDIPTAISFGPNMKFWPALVIAVLASLVLGLLLHLLVFRPLRHAPPLAKVVASVGVFLLLQAVVIGRFGATPRTVRSMPFVGTDQVDLGPVRMAQEQLFVAVLVVVCSVALWAVFRFTRFGLATRAAAENERGAVVLGLSPDRLAAANWVLSTVITGLLGIFVASVNSNVDPVVIPALIVPALTAALVGGFRSFGVTAVAAFLLGMQLPLVQYLGATKDWYPTVDGLAIPGVDTLVPLLVIVAVLYLRGNALPGRGAEESEKLPFAPTPSTRSLLVAGPVAAAAVGLVALFWLGPEYRAALGNSFVGVILCLSVVVATGYVGQLSLAPMAFAGISAFAVAELSTDRGWPFPWPILLGGALAACVGLLVAVPALRIRGVNLAIVTLAFGVAMDRLVFDNRLVNGGVAGAIVDGPRWVDQRNAAIYSPFGPVDIGDGRQPNPMSALFCLVVAVALCYLVAVLRRSRWGRQMIAVRANERAAAAAGVDVARTKALAFAVSAFIAGVGGAVLAYRSGRVDQGRFSYEQSLLLFAFAYIGGITRISGALAGGALVSGGIVFVAFERELGLPEEYTLLLGGLALIASVIANPQGVAHQLVDVWRRYLPAGADPGPDGSPPGETIEKSTPAPEAVEVAR